MKQITAEQIENVVKSNQKIMSDEIVKVFCDKIQNANNGLQDTEYKQYAMYIAAIGTATSLSSKMIKECLIELLTE